MQSSRLAQEVGKPTRCAASCQIARGELSLMHLYNTCIIQIIICNICNICKYDIYVTYTFCYHLDKENMSGELEAIVELELQQSRA